jgi:hypothetical protein
MTDTNGTLQAVLGVPGGLAPLNEMSQVPTQYLPTSLQAAIAEDEECSIDGGELL